RLDGLATPPPAHVPILSGKGAPPVEPAGKQGRVIAITSPSGGVGRSTLAANLALALRSITEDRVALMDGSLRYGDQGVLLNVRSSRTIVDLCHPQGGADVELLDTALVAHPSGVRVLLAPSSPEFGELVSTLAVSQLL